MKSFGWRHWKPRLSTPLLYPQSMLPWMSMRGRFCGIECHLGGEIKLNLESGSSVFSFVSLCELFNFFISNMGL